VLRLTACRTLIGTLFLLVMVGPTLGDAELLLVDGTVLHGTGVRRDNGIYVLTLEDGSEAAFPEELIQGVRLIQAGDPVSSSGALRPAEPRELGAPVPDGPSGLRRDGPQTLAGRPVEPPRRSEQLEVLGPRAEFQKDIVDHGWRPESDWEMDPEKNNNFAPSTWSDGVIDPNWQPESAFDADDDVMEKSRSTWQKGVIDSTWEPTDGFKSSVGRR